MTSLTATYIYLMYCEGNLLDLNDIPKYVWCLFTNFLDAIREMKERGTMWINHDELGREDLRDIKSVLFGPGNVFDALSIDQETIPSVQQFVWIISGTAYAKLRSLSASEYIISRQFVCDVVSELSEYRVAFHFRFYRQYSADERLCAVFVKIDQFPVEVKRLRIEIDMKWDKKKLFKRLLRTRILSQEHKVIGFVTFDHREVGENQKMEWVFAVKMFSVETAEVDEEDEYLQDLYRIFEGK